MHSSHCCSKYKYQTTSQNNTPDCIAECSLTRLILRAFHLLLDAKRFEWDIIMLDISNLTHTLFLFSAHYGNLFVCVIALRHSQQFFSHVSKFSCLPGSNLLLSRG